MSTPPADPDPPEVAELLTGFSGELAFDLGANTGATAALLAQRFAHVVALEPCAESFAQLAVLDAPNVTARRLAVSDRAGLVDLAVQRDPIRTGQLTTDGTRDEWGEVLQHRTVPATTVDALAVEHGTPELVKVDVEGHELRVIHGATRTLERARPGLLIEVHGQRLGEAIIALLWPLYPQLRRVPHPRYEAGQWGATNHFWLVAGRQTTGMHSTR